MKNLIKSILILSVFTFIATSCGEDEKVFAKPVIKNLEVGGHHHEDEGEKNGEEEGKEGVGHIGEDLHIEADIIAEGRIAYIMVEIHNEKTGKDVLEKKFTGDFVGKLNANFHKHVDIPASTPEGEYHFHLKVVDQQNQETEVEKEIKLENEGDK